MTTTRKQLFTAVAMLLVAALSLGTATYAWFVNNTAVEVETMTFTAESSEALEIALTTNAWTGAISGENATPGAFKGRISTTDLTGLYGGFTATWGAVMAPTSTIDLKNFFKQAAWDEGYEKVTTFAAVANVGDVGTVKMIPLFLKSSKAMDVYLDTAATTVTSTGGAVKAARIGFLTEDGNDVIWAPVVSTDNVATARTTSLNDVDGITEAVSATNNTAGMIATVLQATDLEQVGASLTDPDGGAVSTNIEPKTGANSLVSLSENVAKRVLVFIWLEGCDVDCVTEIADDDLAVNLKFLGKAQ